MNGLLVVRLWWVLGALAFSAGVSARDLPEFAELVERFGPAVVNVSSTLLSRDRQKEPVPDFLRRFGPRHAPTPKDEDEGESLGSGFIVSADGFILTNAHVVEGADEITVRLVDKREFRARLIGSDKRSDVAVLKIEATALPRVTIGDPALTRVGDWVVAIGSPFGFEHSVTAGIISAKGRSLPDESIVPFIQTDVAINPGNSGGPLFNLKGEVVGINSQIYSETGGFMGLSFAIPIDVAMDVHNQLRARGRVTRGRIGVVIQEMTRDLADSFGLKNPQGALVSEVEKGGPADKAGIVIGDVIVRFDGKPIQSSSDLPRVVGATKPGVQAPMQLLRQGAARDMTVAVALLPEPETETAAPAAPRRPAASANGQLGIVVAPPTVEQKRRLKGVPGVAVKEVHGLAVRAQLGGGDLIVSGVRRGVSSEFRNVEQFNRFASAIERGESVSLLVRRGESQSFVSLHVPR